MIKFNPVYFLLAIALFIIEVLIALYMNDTIIRPFGGDFLVVILIYAFVKSFITTPPVRMAIYVLLFAYTIEVSQYFHLVDVIGLGNSRLARVVMGDYFAWGDMLAYTLGIVLVLIVEQARIKRMINKAYSYEDIC